MDHVKRTLDQWEEIKVAPVHKFGDATANITLSKSIDTKVGPVPIIAKAGCGNATVCVRRDPEGGAPVPFSVNATTSSGNAEVYVPADFTGRIEASARSGNVCIDVPSEFLGDIVAMTGTGNILINFPKDFSGSARVYSNARLPVPEPSPFSTGSIVMYWTGYTPLMVNQPIWAINPGSLKVLQAGGDSVNIKTESGNARLYQVSGGHERQAGGPLGDFRYQTNDAAGSTGFTDQGADIIEEIISDGAARLEGNRFTFTSGPLDGSDDSPIFGGVKGITVGGVIHTVNGTTYMNVSHRGPNTPSTSRQSAAPGGFSLFNGASNITIGSATFHNYFDS